MQQTRAAQTSSRSPFRLHRTTAGAVALILAIHVPGLPAAAPDSARLLKAADLEREVDYLAFTRTLQQVQQERQLPRTLAERLHFLEAWKDAYEGHDVQALEELKWLAAGASDDVVRFRAEATAAHVLSLARRDEDAYALMADALERLPRIRDPQAREEGLLEAAEMYGEAGQYDLSLRYAQTVIDENWNGRGRCEGGSEQVRSLQAAERLDDEDQILAVIQYCKRVHELLYATQARMALAELYSRKHRYDDAIRLLATHYDEVQRLYNPRVLLAYNAQLAQVYYNRGLLSLARELARRVALSSIDRYSAPLATAYHVLYEIARDQGDYHMALNFHEKYAAVDKAYLDEVSARALALQKVMHESLAKQLELETLNRRNRLLQLQTQLSEASAKASRLQVALLTVVLSFMGALAALIAVWAYRTKRLQLHFMTLSRTDSLTGIYNRPYFIEQAESLLEHSKRAGLEVSVVLWDADHFKGVNDRFGHAAGDSVLRRMAQACKAKLRRTDILGRFGGEEFVVVLPGCGVEEAAERAETMRSGMCQVSVLENNAGSDTVSASFGVTCTRLSGYDLGKLLAHADAALYAAKRAGRNRVVIYDGAGGPGTEPGGKVSGPARGAASASHVHGVQARHRPASRRRWLRSRDGRMRPYRGRVSSNYRCCRARSLCCHLKRAQQLDLRSIHGHETAQDCGRGGLLDP